MSPNQILKCHVSYRFGDRKVYDNFFIYKRIHTHYSRFIPEGVAEASQICKVPAAVFVSSIWYSKIESSLSNIESNLSIKIYLDNTASKLVIFTVGILLSTNFYAISKRKRLRSRKQIKRRTCAIACIEFYF
jgi:hypothetical protein